MSQESLRTQRTKKLIDFLKRKTAKPKELLKETGIPERSLFRILKELEALGLAEKREDGYWAWYTCKRKYNPGLAEHAKQLAPGFEAVLPFYVHTRYTVGDNYLPMEKVNEFKKYALEHIRKGYPVINSSLTQFRKLKSKLDKMQTKETVKFVNKLEREGKTKNAYLLGPFETEEELRDIMEKYDITVHALHRAENGGWFMEGPIYLGKVEVANFLKTREALMQVNESLSAQIGKLLLQIEWGYYHLDGECELCSEIAFADTSVPESDEK